MILIAIPIIISVYGWTILRESTTDWIIGEEYKISNILCGTFLLLTGLIAIGYGIYLYEQKRRRK